MRPMPRYFLIRMEKELMKQKRSLPGGLVVPDTDETGRYSLQYGTILEVGKLNGEEYANKDFPEAKVGDTLIIHHWIETDESVILKQDDDYVYLVVDDDYQHHSIRGVQKPDGKIIPHPNWIWGKEPEAAKEEGQWEVTAGGLFLFKGEFENEEMIRQRIEKAEEHSKYMAQNTSVENEVIARKLYENQKEGEKLTQRLNEKKAVETELVFIHPETLKRMDGAVEAGDAVFASGWADVKGYGLNLGGVDYLLTREVDVLFIAKKSIRHTVRINKLH